MEKIDRSDNRGQTAESTVAAVSEQSTQAEQMNTFMSCVVDVVVQVYHSLVGPCNLLCSIDQPIRVLLAGAFRLQSSHRGRAHKSERERERKTERYRERQEKKRTSETEKEKRANLRMSMRIDLAVLIFLDLIITTSMMWSVDESVSMSVYKYSMPEETERESDNEQGEKSWS